MNAIMSKKFEANHFMVIKGVGLAEEGLAKFHESSGLAYTLCSLSGVPLACVGFHAKWSGCGEMWAVFSPRARGVLRIPHVMRKMMDIAQNDGWIRLQAAVRTDWPEAIRFVEWLGMKKEGLMEAFGPNEADHYLYARVRRHGNG